MAFLTGNALKILAAVFMTADHAGILLFPRSTFLRIIGRLAFPIFAYMIAEGCRYTRNKKRYLGGILSLAVLCQAVYFVVDGSMYLSILFTFSLSILTIYALQRYQAVPTAGNALLLAGTVCGVYLLNQWFTIDYGFFGCIVPVLAALPRQQDSGVNRRRIALFSVGLALLSLDLGGIQPYCLLSLPLLLLYSGKRGKANLKYFFYLFYPIHLAVLQGLAFLL